MILRIISGAALLLLGYYIGREVGRTDSIRKELENAREAEKQSATEKAPARKKSGSEGKT